MTSASAARTRRRKKRNECKACRSFRASLPSFRSHWRPIGDTFNHSHFSLMRLKALLAAVAVSAAGLVFASSAEAGYSCWTDSIGIRKCSGDGIDATGITDSIGVTRWSGTDSNGNSFSRTCIEDSIGITRCN